MRISDWSSDVCSSDLGQALEFLEQQARAAPEVAAIGYRGESQSLRETGSSIWLVFGLTILIVYLLLAAQFESFVHPAIIVTTVPLAVAGGVIGLALARSEEHTSELQSLMRISY